ncbi:hypothetical protein PanWU01x14_138980 [Parasponia andersonii]|uniref:Uncharacterized protein n=1 Tax=Parasponia andersonii TaxID=3476 RepID=A0A2P5CMV9_PARAD|nr:hypothetical protein PanWU01x14_138980 [Parasponia andersonii]
MRSFRGKYDTHSFKNEVTATKVSLRDEKIGGSGFRNYDGSGLREFLFQTGSIDVGCTGGMFKWTKGRILEHLVKERLDRDSDHAPILVDTRMETQAIRTPFRFLEAWSRDPSYQAVIGRLQKKLPTGGKIGKYEKGFKEMEQDDVFLFCGANLGQVSSLQWCLDTYCSWSGQIVNQHKSTLVLSSNCRQDVRDSITDLLGYKEMHGDETFLGNPLFLSNSRVRDFKFLKDAVYSRLEGWKCKLLSRAGRTTLIKSVVQSIPTYSIASFNLPISLCEDLDKAIRKFWWTGSLEKNKFLSLMSWDSLCQPKVLWRIWISPFQGC